MTVFENVAFGLKLQKLPKTRSVSGWSTCSLW